jgi:predicted DCC family thiol-disulfide oxidoreductase YuxK
MTEIDSLHIIFYDGDCGLCNRSVQWVLLRDIQRRFTFCALQSEFAQNVGQKWNTNLTSFESIVLYKNQKLYFKSEAALEILSELPRFSFYAHIFKKIPSFLRDGIYDIVAKYRRRWFKPADRCLWMRGEWEGRFL